MYRTFWTAVRYFAFGLLLGYLTAPRSGLQTRRLVADYMGALLSDLFGMRQVKVPSEGESITPLRRSQM